MTRILRRDEVRALLKDQQQLAAAVAKLEAAKAALRQAGGAQSRRGRQQQQQEEGEEAQEAQQEEEEEEEQQEEEDEQQQQRQQLPPPTMTVEELIQRLRNHPYCRDSNFFTAVNRWAKACSPDWSAFTQQPVANLLRNPGALMDSFTASGAHQHTNPLKPKTAAEYLRLLVIAVELPKVRAQLGGEEELQQLLDLFEAKCKQFRAGAAAPTTPTTGAELPSVHGPRTRQQGEGAGAAVAAAPSGMVKTPAAAAAAAANASASQQSPPDAAARNTNARSDAHRRFKRRTNPGREQQVCRQHVHWMSLMG